MPLKIKNTEVHHTVDYFDFNNFIEEEFGQPFEIVADQESGNDTVISFNVTGRTWDEDNPEPGYHTKPGMDDYDRAAVEEFRRSGSYSFLAGALMEYLCVEGKIVAGNYLIEVCW